MALFKAPQSGLAQVLSGTAMELRGKLHDWGKEFDRLIELS